MAKAVLGSSHPAVVACAIVQSLTIDDPNMLIWRTINDILGDGLGAEDLGVVRAQDWYDSTLLIHGSVEEALQLIDRGSAGNKIWEPEYCLRQGIVLVKLGRYQDAEFSLRKCLAMTKHIRDDALLGERPPNRGLLRGSTAAMTTLATVLECQDKYLAAKKQWLETISFIVRVFGFLDHRTLENVSEFEIFLQRHAQYEEAAALRSQYPHIFQ